MAKIGDTVRFLNAIGGGKITRIEGKVAYVDENGFETPVMLNEIVVVLPAGHEAKAAAGAKMFDQAAFDAGRDDTTRPLEKTSKGAAAQPDEQKAAFEGSVLPPAPETDHGERLNLVLAFEPSNVKNLPAATFNAVLVNDSNYNLLFTLSRRRDEERGWTLVYSGEVAANEIIDLARLTHENIGDFERIAFQAAAYKRGKEFSLKPPVGVSRRLDLTKFHKLHCFRPGVYFDTPVLEVPLVTDDRLNSQVEVDASGFATAMGGRRPSERSDSADEAAKMATALADKFRVDTRRGKKNPAPDSNPTKVLPLIEVDLHIGELLDTVAGMDNKAILQRQLREVRDVMGANSRRIGQKIVFIHGKGEGVLRRAVLDLLRKEYPKAELQDASFAEYGFGATLVTIH